VVPEIRSQTDTQTHKHRDRWQYTDHNTLLPYLGEVTKHASHITLPVLQLSLQQAVFHWSLVQTCSHCQLAAMHHSFDNCHDCHQMSINVDRQTQNSIDDLVVLYTRTPSWQLVTRASDCLALESQLQVEKLDHPASSLMISSAFQQHDVSCESTDCRDMTETCFVCTSRKFSEPRSVHENCGYLTAACDDHCLVGVTAAHHSVAAVNAALPDRAPDSLADHTMSPIPLHLHQCYHHRHHLYIAL